jgi:catechol-2,3-dioxygenase
MELKHLHLHVRSRAKSTAFYSEWFGLTTQRSFDSLTFLTDGAGFELALMADAAPQPMPPWFHFGFRLQSAAAVVALSEQMQGAGVALAKGIYQDESLASFRCIDPDGYVIEVYWEATAAPVDEKPRAEQPSTVR